MCCLAFNSRGRPHLESKSRATINYAITRVLIAFTTTAVEYWIMFKGWSQQLVVSELRDVTYGVTETHEFDRQAHVECSCDLSKRFDSPRGIVRALEPRYAVLFCANRLSKILL
jgi:hypothetical protein